MAIVLALCAACGYGVTDFIAGIVSRRHAAGPVTAILQGIGLLTAAVGVLTFPGVGPRAGALLLGALGGLGGSSGGLALYHGMIKGSMAIVATLSAVLSAVLPVIVGLVLGQPLTVTAAIGIGIAIPAILLVCWQPGGPGGMGSEVIGSSTPYGLLSGAGFALLFIAFDRAGTRSGAWPLLTAEAAGLMVLLPFARPAGPARGALMLKSVGLVAVAGMMGAVSNLLYLAATGHGELAIVAVLSAMYPAVTVLMARVLLAERTTRLQAVGLLAAAVAVVLVTIG